MVRYSTSRSAADRVAVTSYPTNARGETYGSYLDRNTVGQAPDLIAAMGENGVEGYIRLNDIAPELFTLEEIRQYQAQVDANPVIPLYDLDVYKRQVYATHSLTLPCRAYFIYGGKCLW